MKQISVPDDHQIGMVVPQGGSNCAKCTHVSTDQKRCDQPEFIKWNGSEELPASADRYCCDFFESGRTKTIGQAMQRQRARK